VRFSIKNQGRDKENVHLVELVLVLARDLLDAERAQLLPEVAELLEQVVLGLATELVRLDLFFRTRGEKRWAPKLAPFRWRLIVVVTPHCYGRVG
jgi:hypothetical protein